MNLAVIGLGKLGLPLAVLQAQNHNVIGVDLDDDIIKKLNDGVSTIIEPDVPKLLSEGIKSRRFRATSDFMEIGETDISLVIVPTPSMESGKFTSRYVLKAVEKIGEAISSHDQRHVVVICSTVMPGECAGPIALTLEKHSGRTVGDTVGLVYSPEFIALGNVIAGMQFPAMTLIGESDMMSGATYSRICPQDVPIRYMSLTSAEIAKISLNAFVTQKISFANTLGEICENVLDADAQVIAEAIGLDPRVGSPYIQPGGPYGGPCFPRDSRAFGVFAQESGVSAPLAAAADEINNRQVDRVIARIKSFGRDRVGVLGLTYKSGAPIVEESFGLKLVKQLVFLGYQVAVYDSLLRSKPEDLPEECTWHYGPEPCIGNTTTSVITIPDPSIRRIFPDIFANDARISSVVIDCWDFLPDSPWDDTHIVRLGKGELCS